MRSFIFAHCPVRPWELNKFKSKEEQDKWPPALLDWVRAYYSRTDDRSQSAHRRIFDSLSGAKQEVAIDDDALYDLLFDRLDYYLALAQAADGPVLAVACGTG